jgi:protein SCO1/2
MPQQAHAVSVPTSSNPRPQALAALPADPMHGLAATFAACLAVLVAGLAAMFQATAGGTAFTTETLRRSAIAQAPASVPDFVVVDSQGQRSTLHALLAQGGRAWIVDFVYTRCNTLCLAQGSVFQQLQAQLLAQGLQDRVGLLSISFDPLHDQPPQLAAYAQRMQMQRGLWKLVSLQNEPDRRRLLDSFGIMVVPAALGEFEHNAALHVVTSQGQLVRIVGLDESAQALAMAARAGTP